MEVIYDKKHVHQLSELRLKALRIMNSLHRFHLRSITHGSVARGDTSRKSDIDVFLPNPPSSFIIESALQQAKIPINRRTIIQATPLYAAKGYIELGSQEGVSFPLVKLRPVEKDFYRFGGEASRTALKEERRVPGVDKRLMLIEPTASGHIESSIVGREEETAGLLGISVTTVFDRVHALLRREKTGRTGVFIERELLPGESFEMVLKKLADQNPAIRRRLNF